MSSFSLRYLVLLLVFYSLNTFSQTKGTGFGHVLATRFQKIDFSTQVAQITPTNPNQTITQNYVLKTDGSILKFSDFKPEGCPGLDCDAINITADSQVIPFTLAVSTDKSLNVQSYLITAAAVNFADVFYNELETGIKEDRDDYFFRGLFPINASIAAFKLDKGFTNSKIDDLKWDVINAEFAIALGENGNAREHQAIGVGANIGGGIEKIRTVDGDIIINKAEPTNEEDPTNIENSAFQAGVQLKYYNAQQYTKHLDGKFIVGIKYDNIGRAPGTDATKRNSLYLNSSYSLIYNIKKNSESSFEFEFKVNYPIIDVVDSKTPNGKKRYNLADGNNEFAKITVRLNIY